MLALYYIYFFLIAVPVLFSLTVLTCIVILIGTAIGNGSWWGYYPAMVWAKVFCILSLVKVSVRGRENIDKRTSYVFVANHQGAYDIFSVYGYLGHNFKWMMKKSLRKIMLVGYTCQKCGHIFVDRSSPTAIRRTIETAEKRLRDGMSLVVFPEGARTFTGKMGPFKKGAYQLALEFHLPLVPVTIDGSFDIMPRTRYVPRPGRIVLTIHKPIAPPADEAARAEVIEQTRQAIESSLGNG
ncbi:MAG: 1-acyl-sn-glycerol-3-phosphate acyltransferase [Bacteroidales bacterium 52_46]|nr:MAG: 1-acyl-sn-glycerol-3-phosphate acyltransferase [Bacteroidales bacterium 52_46]